MKESKRVLVVEDTPTPRRMSDAWLVVVGRNWRDLKVVAATA